MKFKSVLGAVGKVLKGTAKNVVPVVGPLLDTVLGVMDQNAKRIDGTPEERMAWEKMRGDLQARRDEIQAQVEQKLADTDSEIYRAAQETMRQALKSGDAYVRRMTPTIGYLWTISLFLNYGLTAVVNFFLAVEARLSPVALPWEFWMIGGSLLGFRIHTRRKEKEQGVAS